MATRSMHLALIAAALTSCMPVGAVMIVEDGQPRAAIVVADDAPEALRQACVEMQALIEEYVEQAASVGVGPRHPDSAPAAVVAPAEPAAPTAPGLEWEEDGRRIFLWDSLAIAETLAERHPEAQ